MIMDRVLDIVNQHKIKMNWQSAEETKKKIQVSTYQSAKDFQASIPLPKDEKEN